MMPAGSGPGLRGRFAAGRDLRFGRDRDSESLALLAAGPAPAATPITRPRQPTSRRAVTVKVQPVHRPLSVADSVADSEGRPLLESSRWNWSESQFGHDMTQSYDGRRLARDSDISTCPLGHEVGLRVESVGPGSRARVDS